MRKESGSREEGEKEEAQIKERGEKGWRRIEEGNGGKGEKEVNG